MARKEGERGGARSETRIGKICTRRNHQVVIPLWSLFALRARRSSARRGTGESRCARGWIVSLVPRDYGNFDVSFNMARLGVAGRWFTEIGLEIGSVWVCMYTRFFFLNSFGLV